MTLHKLRSRIRTIRWVQRPWYVPSYRVCICRTVSQSSYKLLGSWYLHSIRILFISYLLQFLPWLYTLHPTKPSRITRNFYHRIKVIVSKPLRPKNVGPFRSQCRYLQYMISLSFFYLIFFLYITLFFNEQLYKRNFRVLALFTISYLESVLILNCKL